MGGPGAYGVTKAALNALTLRLSRELPAVVKVNAVDPGWVRSRMERTSVRKARLYDLAALCSNAAGGWLFVQTLFNKLY